MRRALLREWPALSYLYGLHPWDVERLTEDELHEYLAEAPKIIKALQRR